MLDLILTLDYEICGNGAGDVRRDIIEPTGRILDICDRYGAKLTIMFEVGEYWGFERYDAQLREDLGYSPHQRMKEQAIRAIERGHDVQLHLHPQWIGARYEEGRWRLQNTVWRLADLPNGLGDAEQITSITGSLYAGKRTLEQMIQPVKSDYECNCFRAGGFYAQPSQQIITAMKQVGLKADSSVVRGYRKAAPFAVDYSHVKTDNAIWWTTEAELVAEGEPGENILELPVTSRMQPYLMSLTMTRLRAISKMRRIESVSENRDTSEAKVSSFPPIGEVLKRLVRKCPSILDFCKLSAKDMLKRIKALRASQQSPVVMIGHSKDFVNEAQFGRFLAGVTKGGDATFRTMSEYVGKVSSPAPVGRSSEDGGSNLGGSEAA